MTRSLHFTVLGRPQPAGSKRAFIRRKGGKVVGVGVDDSAKGSGPWRALVSAAAVEALGGTLPIDPEPLAGALVLEVTFWFARPVGHFGTGRNAGTVRASAPAFPAKRPDTTKLLRALEDALTGLVWRDDAQVVTQLARKRYGTPERAEVIVAEEGRYAVNLRKVSAA